MGNKNQHEEGRLIEVGPGFWNIRASFHIHNVLDIGTHMSIIRVNENKFLIVDTVPLDDALKNAIDELTDNGNLIDAVIATHPFHTLAFPKFYEAYPNVPYYGTPRHLVKQPDIPWAGSISDNFSKWENDVFMRIPDGSEFVNPLPEKSNHFSSVWVFAAAARTIHIDDTVMCYDPEHASGVVNILTKLARKSGHMSFHLSMTGPGLYHTSEAPYQFKAWVEKILVDWDFDNICTAHLGNKIGGAKEELERTLRSNEKTFRKLSEKYAKEEPNEETKCAKRDDSDSDVDDDEISNYNAAGCECG